MVIRKGKLNIYSFNSEIIMNYLYIEEIERLKRT